MHVADSMRPIHNLVISNVPGPPSPLYLAGAELVAAYPMGPIMDGAGLNVTVLSYRDHIDIGFMADRDLVPDVWDLAASVTPAFEELLALAEDANPMVRKSAAPVTPTSKAARANKPKAKTGQAEAGQAEAGQAEAGQAEAGQAEAGQGEQAEGRGAHGSRGDDVNPNCNLF